MQNQISPQKNNTSGFRGVSFSRGRWLCRVRCKGIAKRNYGHFDTPEEAHARYLEIKAQIHKGYLPK